MLGKLKFAEYEVATQNWPREYKVSFANEPVHADLNAHELGSAVASRVSSQQAIQQISERSFILGGSADLSASNNTMVKAESDFQADNYAGRNMVWCA